MRRNTLFICVLLLGFCSACQKTNNLVLTETQFEQVTPSPENLSIGNSKSSTPISFNKSDQRFESIPTWQISLADLDYDGDLDAVFANSLTNSSQLWLNDGKGNFVDSGQEFGKYGHGVAVGDVNGDALLDIVITTHNDLPTRVYLNNGQANFVELEKAFLDTTGYSVELYDLDGDSDLDAIGEGSGNSNLVWNDGNGIFVKSGATFTVTAVWGDLDADGDVDFFHKEVGVGYSAYLNDGNGNFEKLWALIDLEAMSLGDMALGDVDGDSDLDVVVTNGFHQTTSYPAKILLNDGNGQFMDSGQKLGGVASAGVSFGDLDGDQDLDLVFTDYMKPCQIWINDGLGRFIDSQFRFGENQFYRHAHLGDLDNDGDLDIFLATFGMDKGPNEIWFNHGQNQE